MLFKRKTFLEKLDKNLRKQGHGGLAQISTGGTSGRLVVAIDGTMFLLSNEKN